VTFLRHEGPSVQNTDGGLAVRPCGTACHASVTEARVNVLVEGTGDGFIEQELVPEGRDRPSAHPGRSRSPSRALWSAPQGGSNMRHKLVA
jgi:hypothetical protein